MEGLREALATLVAFWGDGDDALSAVDAERAGEVIEEYCDFDPRPWEREDGRAESFLAAARGSVSTLDDVLTDDELPSFGRAACGMVARSVEEALDQVEAASGSGEVTAEYEAVTHAARSHLCP